MAEPLYLGAVDNGTNGSGNVTVDLTPLGLQEGDHVVAFGGGTDPHTNPNPVSIGYDELARYVEFDAGSPNCGVWVKKMGAVPDTTFVGAGSGTGVAGSQYQCRAWRGLDDDVIDALVTLITGTSGAPQSSPANTSETPDAVSLSIVMRGAVTGNPSHATAAPTDYDELLTRRVGNTWNNTLAAAIRPLPTPGTYDPGVFTWATTTSGQSLAFHVILKPFVPVPDAPVVTPELVGSGFLFARFTHTSLTMSAMRVRIECWDEDLEVWTNVTPGGALTVLKNVDNDADWIFLEDQVLGAVTMFSGLPVAALGGEYPLGGLFRIQGQIDDIGGTSEWGALEEFELWLPHRRPAAPANTVVTQTPDLVVISPKYMQCSGVASTDPPCSDIVTQAAHLADEEPNADPPGPANKMYRFALLWSYQSDVAAKRWLLQTSVGGELDTSEDPPDQVVELAPEQSWTIRNRWITGAMENRLFAGPGFGALEPGHPQNDDFPELYDANGSLAMSVESDAIEIDTGEPDDPCESIEEDFETECDGHTLTVNLGEVACGTTDGVWWRIGRVVGGAWAGTESFIVLNGGASALQRTFPLLDYGIQIGVGWVRRIGGVWQDFSTYSTPQVICTTPDAVPLPFFENPPGYPYAEDFTLSWHVDRGASSGLPAPAERVYRTRHRPLDATEDDWVTIAEDQTETELTTDFVDGLEVGAYHLIGVTTVDPDRESPEAQFIFRKKSLANFHIRDFKNLEDLAADAVEAWNPERMLHDHVNGLGTCSRKASTYPVVFEAGNMVFEDIGTTPLGTKGVLCFGDRLRSEGNGNNKFQAITFIKWGVALAINGTGTDKTQWGGLLLRVTHGQPWGFGSTPRIPGDIGGVAGVHAEYNRVAWGDSDPFFYGRAHGFTIHVLTKRIGTSLFQSTQGHASIAAIYVPTNALYGLRAYSLVWEFVKVEAGWTLRYMVLGPDCSPEWLVSDLVIPEFQIQNGTLRQLPIGLLGLTTENPVQNGDGVYHSLVVEELVGVPEIISSCPLPPATLNTAFSYQLELDVDLPDGFEFVITDGALPTGLTLNAETGVISGTPTVEGTWRFCIALSDGVTEEGEFCCELVVTSTATLAGCAKDFLVLGSRVGVSAGDIFHPDALDSFTSELSVEEGIVLAVRTHTYAAEGTDGEGDFRRLYVSGYNRGFVGMWVTPFFDGRPFNALRKWLSAPAPQSNRTERFHLWMELGEIKELIEGQDQTGAVRASVWAVQIETTDPDDQWHLETVTMAWSPITDARIIKTTELQLQERL